MAHVVPWDELISYFHPRAFMLSTMIKRLASQPTDPTAPCRSTLQRED